MKRIHLDAVGGIAGDMFVAAMLDALPELKARVLADAQAVVPSSAGVIHLTEGESGSIRVLRFGLDTPPAPVPGHGARVLAHAHADGHGHSHNQGEPPRSYLRQAERSPSRFADLVARIEAAPLSDGTAREAVAILTILAKAEAVIHGVPVADVHFHELADWDSLLDVVAAGSIAAALSSALWSVSPLPRGGGLVRTAHGMLPVPAPATVAILEGFDWRDDGIPGERVTPTGAAILKHLVGPGGGEAAGRLTASGTGAGTRHLPGLPNVLRALVFDGSLSLPRDIVGVIEFDVDDMTGEEIGVACERLRSLDGVLDLTVAQAYGKKGRPVSSFRLLVRPERVEAVAERCFAETSTIGLRRRDDQRLVLRRQAGEVNGLPVKIVERPGGTTRKAESDAIPGDDLAARRRNKQQAEDDHA